MRQGTSYELSLTPVRAAKEAFSSITNETPLRMAARATQRAALSANDATRRIGEGDFDGADLVALSAFDAACYAQRSAERTLKIANRAREDASALLDKIRHKHLGATR